MRIAIIPVETETYPGKYELHDSIVLPGDGAVDKSGPAVVLLSSSSVGYLLSYLEQYFPDDTIYAAPDLDFLIRTKPDIVGISAPYSQTFNRVLDMASEIKKQLKVPVILGGQHITYLPKSLPVTADIGVIGEGEETFRELIQLYKEDGGFADKKLSKIPGIVFHYKEQKTITPKRRLIFDLDAIPLTRKFFYKSPTFWQPSVCSGRGTLYKAFNTVDSGPVRLHSAERMISDFIDILTYYPESRFISITDELFLHDLNRLQRFAEIVRETDLTRFFRFNISALPEQLTDEVFSILKYSLDINSLNIIFSSPSVKTQKELKEPRIDTDTQRKLFEKCYKYGLKTSINYLLGAPGESREDMAKSYWFVRQNTTKIYNNLFVKARLLVPFPDTEAWSKAIIKRLLNDNFREWELLDENQYSKDMPLLNTNVNSAEFSRVMEDYRELNIKPKITQLSLRNKSASAIKTITEMAEITIESFLGDRKNKVGESQVYEYKKQLQQLSRISERVDHSFTEELEKILMTHSIDSISQVEEPITKIMEQFQRYNRFNEINRLVNSKEIFNLAIPDVLEQIFKNSNIKTILQVTDPLITDLRNILSFEKKEVDTLLPYIFNNSRPRLNFAKKYDCIVLFFTLDMIRQPYKLLKYCNKILNEHGILIITFFNVKSVIVLTQLLTLDISELFYKFSKLNHFTVDSMTNLLLKNNFIPKKIMPVIYPEVGLMSLSQNLTINLLSNFYNIPEAEYTTFSYTYSCRKQSR